MEDSSVSAIYRSVIDSVIERVKPDFVQEGVDESVLDELRIKWEQKLRESGALEPEPTPALPQRLPARMMPPMPAFLSNLQGQNRAVPGSYGSITTANNALAGSPAQYLQSRQPAHNTSGPQLGTPAINVTLPSDRLHPHLLGSTAPSQQQHQQQQPQQQYYGRPAVSTSYTAQPQPYLQLAAPSGNHTQSHAPFSQQQLGAGGIVSQQRQQPQNNHQQQQAVPGLQSQYQQQQQQAVPGSQAQYQYQQQQQAALAGGKLSQQQQQLSQQGIQPSLQALLSISVAPNSTAGGASETRKRKADDDHGDLFSLLPQPAPSVTAAAAAPSTIPQQDGPGDDEEDDKEATDDEAGKEEAEKGETFSDVSSEPEEDDQDISNIVVGQFEKVQRTRVKWKVHLKDGVMRINGRDHLFHTAVGDMLF